MQGFYNMLNLLGRHPFFYRYLQKKPHKQNATRPVSGRDFWPDF